MLNSDCNSSVSVRNNILKAEKDVDQLQLTGPFPEQSRRVSSTFKARLLWYSSFSCRMFRVVEGGIFLDHFSSDRHHMCLKGGIWLAPPPSYPSIRGRLATTAHNLDTFIAMPLSLTDSETDDAALMTQLDSTLPFGCVVNEDLFKSLFF